MQPKSDVQLLREYAEHGAEAAFTEIVARHTNLVYSAALRQVDSPDIAADVAQSVFVGLARGARSLSRKLADSDSLAGWLCRSARNISLNLRRDEFRRHSRERQAMENTESTSDTTSEWERLRPILDDAMAELSEPDYEALVLRFFKNQDLRLVGLALGVSDDAAQKRVSRALDKLRDLLSRRGIGTSAAALSITLSANAVQAAPVGLAGTISSAAALATASISATTGAGATTGFFGTLVQVTRTKLAAGLAAAIVALTTFMLFRSQERTGQFAITEASPPNIERNQVASGSATQGANAAGGRSEPDALKLLLAVARARERIASGSLELDLFFEHPGPGRSETNHLRLAALFDGPRLRYEQFGREYSYTYSADEAEADNIRRRADRLDRAAAVQAGLLKPFESHHVMTCDGAVLMDYWETDGKPYGTTIDDASRGHGNVIFDPRCLGLSTVLSAGNTVENCLGYNGAKSIELAGKEMVDGVPAWHVQVRSQYDALLDFWIDVARPTRVLKQASGSSFVVSRYDDAHPRDPIPTEVATMDSRNGSPSFGTRFIRSNPHFNVSIDPTSFTLAGLGMQVGTAVSDDRIRRRIGYWTGAGLSENLPPSKGAEPQSAPNPAELLSLLENYPGSPEGLDAATWIMLNTPDGPEVEKAADVIQKEHTRDTNLVSLCQELERVRHRCSKPLLEAILSDNPSADVRGTACFALATLLKDEAKYGQNKKATAEAEKRFERVITEFGQVTQRGLKLEDVAKPELSELRRLTIGKPAPEIEGEDLNGQPMKLSDYRGKVAVLTFWWPGYIEAPDHRKLVERMTGKPFAFIGVYGDDDLTKAKADVEKYGITWPSFRDKRHGPISANWNVRSWPNVWVLDPQGVIRYRGVRRRELAEAVETLLPK